MDDFFPDEDYARAVNNHPLGDPRYVSQFLNQGENWVANGGQVVPIASMGRSHALNCLQMLRRTAGAIAMTVHVRDLFSTTPMNGAYDRMTDDRSARQQVLTSPLAQALARAAVEGTDEQLPAWAQRQP